MADEHWLGYESIHNVLQAHEGEYFADQVSLEILDDIDGYGLTILPFSLIEMMLFEMSQMTLDKRQFVIWNRVADAVGWERKHGEGR